MEFLFVAIGLAFLLYGGWNIIRNRLKEQKEGLSLYLVVQNQENCLEGMIRRLFRNFSRQETPLRVILLVENSQDQTFLIAQRLARKYYFELIEIEDLKEWQISTSFVENEGRMLLDLRGEENVLQE